MATVVKPVRIQPAWDDREAVRALFYGNTRYQAAAAYLPDGSQETGNPLPAGSALPWFRATWALGGQPNVEGIAPLLHNHKFVAAARTIFKSARIVPKTIVVNVNAPMPAGAIHVDVPSFRGATRETLCLRLLIAMGASGLFEQWRATEASAISWFYDGPGGGFNYWPSGPGGPMLSERSPFGNVAIIGDNDRMYHRIGSVGESGAVLPRMSAAAEIRPRSDGHWSIVENGEERACYAPGAVRLSVLWKAEVLLDDRRVGRAGSLSPERVVEIIQSDLHRRGVAMTLPADPLADTEWIALSYRTYTCAARAASPKACD
jgi:hypothetical protein